MAENHETNEHAKIFKTDVVGIGPWCVEFPDGEIITTRTEERAQQIAAPSERERRLKDLVMKWRNDKRPAHPSPDCENCANELEAALADSSPNHASAEPPTLTVHSVRELMMKCHGKLWVGDITQEFVDGLIALSREKAPDEET